MFCNKWLAVRLEYATYLVLKLLDHAIFFSDCMPKYVKNTNLLHEDLAKHNKSLKIMPAILENRNEPSQWICLAVTSPEGGKQQSVESVQTLTNVATCPTN